MTPDEVVARFPGATLVDASAADRHRWCLGYCRGLWGDHDGYACLGHGRPYLDGGKYRHRGFAQTFYEWPAKQVAIASAAMRLSAGGEDVYVAPMLRAERSRMKYSGAGGQWAWADLDGAMTPERVDVLRALGDAVRVVSSGTAAHIYFRLDDWYPVERVVDTNRALAAMLDADSKWDDTAFLRPPGTYNRKPIVFRGEPPALVQVIHIGGDE